MDRTLFLKGLLDGLAEAAARRREPTPRQPARGPYLTSDLEGGGRGQAAPPTSILYPAGTRTPVVVPGGYLTPPAGYDLGPVNEGGAPQYVTPAQTVFRGTPAPPSQVVDGRGAAAAVVPPPPPPDAGLPPGAPPFPDPTAAERMGLAAAHPNQLAQILAAQGVDVSQPPFAGASRRSFVARPAGPGEPAKPWQPYADETAPVAISPGDAPANRPPPDPPANRPAPAPPPPGTDPEYDAFVAEQTRRQGEVETGQAALDEGIVRAETAEQAAYDEFAAAQAAVDAVGRGETPVYPAQYVPYRGDGENTIAFGEPGQEGVRLTNTGGATWTVEERQADGSWAVVGTFSGTDEQAVAEGQRRTAARGENRGAVGAQNWLVGAQEGLRTADQAAREASGETPLGNVVAPVVGLIDAPQKAVAGQMAEWAVEDIRNGDPAGTTFTLLTGEAEGTGGALAAVMEAGGISPTSFNAFAEEHRQQVLYVYDNGYVDDNGVRHEPGAGAVVAYWEDSLNLAQEVGFQIATDPLNALGLARASGRAVRSAGSALVETGARQAAREGAEVVVDEATGRVLGVAGRAIGPQDLTDEAAAVLAREGAEAVVDEATGRVLGVAGRAIGPQDLTDEGAAVLAREGATAAGGPVARTPRNLAGVAGRALEALGDVLGIPDAVLNETADQILPAVVKLPWSVIQVMDEALLAGKIARRVEELAELPLATRARRLAQDMARAAAAREAGRAGLDLEEAAGPVVDAATRTFSRYGAAEYTPPVKPTPYDPFVEVGAEGLPPGRSFDTPPGPQMSDAALARGAGDQMLMVDENGNVVAVPRTPFGLGDVRPEAPPAAIPARTGPITPEPPSPVMMADEYGNVVSVPASRFDMARDLRPIHRPAALPAPRRPVEPEYLALPEPRSAPMAVTRQGQAVPPFARRAEGEDLAAAAPDEAVEAPLFEPVEPVVKPAWNAPNDVPFRQGRGQERGQVFVGEGDFQLVVRRDGPRGRFAIFRPGVADPIADGIRRQIDAINEARDHLAREVRQTGRRDTLVGRMDGAEIHRTPEGRYGVWLVSDALDEPPLALADTPEDAAAGFEAELDRHLAQITGRRAPGAPEPPPSPAEAVPEEEPTRGWTLPEYRARYSDEPTMVGRIAADDDLAARRPDEVAAFFREYDARRVAYEATLTANPRLSKNPLTTLEFRLDVEELFVDTVPGEPIPPQRWRHGADLDPSNRYNIIEHAAFGTPEDAKAARHLLRRRREHALADRLKEFNAKHQALIDLANERAYGLASQRGRLAQEAPTPEAARAVATAPTTAAAEEVLAAADLLAANAVAPEPALIDLMAKANRLRRELLRTTGREPERLRSLQRELDETAARVERMMGDDPSPGAVGFSAFFRANLLAQKAVAARTVAEARAAAGAAERAAARARLRAPLDPGVVRPVPLAEEDRLLLSQRFANGANAGRTYGEVWDDLYLAAREAGQDPVRATDAAQAGFEAALREEFGVKAPGKWARRYGTAVQAFSEINRWMPWSFVRSIYGDLAGDTFQTLADAGAGAAAHVVYRTLEAGIKRRNVFDDPDGIYRRTGYGRAYRPGSGFNEAVTGKGTESALRRILGPVKLGWVGKPTEVLKNLGNNAEATRRIALHEWHYAAGIEEARAAWVRRAAGHAGLANVPISADEVEATMAARGRWFAPHEVAVDLEKLARSKGARGEAARRYADRAARDWANARSAAFTAAEKRTNDALFSYDYTRADELVRNFVPFHYWATRALPFYVRHAIKNPGLAMAYWRTAEGLRDRAEAEGWPESLKFMAKVWDGPLGFALFLSPFAALGLWDAVLRSSGGYDDPDASLIGQILTEAQGRSGFGLLPWMTAPFSLLGYLGQESLGLDPLGTYGSRKFLGAVIQWAAAEGYLEPLGVDEGTLLPRPYEEMWLDLRAWVSRHVRLPGSSYVPSKDPAAYPKIQIGNAMLGAYLAEKGYASVAEMTEADWDVLAEEFNAEEGERWDAAVQAWVRVNGANALSSAMIPGPKSTRQEGMLDSGWTLGAGPGEVPLPSEDPYADGVLSAEDKAFLNAWRARFGEPYREGDLARYRAGLRGSKAVLEGTPEAQPVLRGDAAWSTIGTAEGRARYDTWRAIAYNEVEGTVTVGGRTWGMMSLAALSQPERFALADQWLIENDPDGQVAALRQQRDLFLETHPEYAEYRAWQSEVRDAWGDSPHGLRAYRLELTRTNPNAARYFRDQQRRILAANPGLSNAELQAELDAITTTPEAYLAVKGIKAYRDDPDPLPTSGRAPASDPRPQGWAPEGDGGGSGRATDRATNVLRTIAQMEALAGMLRGTGVELVHAPPPVREAILAQVPPELLPRDAWIFWDYLEWGNAQRAAGLEPTPQGYVLATANGPWRNTSWVDFGGWQMVGGDGGYGVPPGGTPSNPFAGWLTSAPA